MGLISSPCFLFASRKAAIVIQYIEPGQPDQDVLILRCRQHN
jgi:hypothetical protein